jgi:anti-sigma regulatory factor (Ser/Thr protein kinase)
VKHVALVYASERELLDVVVPFLQEGLERRERVMITVAQDNARALHDALPAGLCQYGVAAQMLDGTPARAIAAWHEFVRAALSDDAPGVRLVGEPFHVARAPAEAREWLRYESVSNEVFDGYPVEALCLFDRRIVPAAVLSQVGATHPEVLSDGSSRHGTGYLDPATFVGRLDEAPLARPTGPVAVLADSSARATTARRFVREAAAELGLTRARLDDAVSAVNEVVINALQHGGGLREVRAWSRPDAVVVEADDAGGRLGDVCAGFRPPSATSERSGLWLARQLSDRLAIRNGPAGTTVQLWFQRASSTCADELTGR